MEKSYFKCLFLGWVPKFITSFQLTSAKLASMEAVLKASNFQSNDLGGGTEMGMMVPREGGSQRRPQAMESKSDKCGIKCWRFHLLAM